MDTYQKVQKGIAALMTGVTEADKIISQIGYKPADKIQELIDGLYSFSTFKERDRVELNKTPVINEKTSWGWIGDKHFLVEGAKATVHGVEWRAKEQTFGYLIQFDQDSWIDPITKQLVYREEHEKHLFFFGEGSLREARE